MLTGIIQKPTIRSYFTTKRVISTLGFGDIITQDRLEYVNFCVLLTNETINNFERPKELVNIFQVISNLNNKFQELYLPNQDISTDESLTLRKGCLSFKQYMPLKASKFGIKTCTSCDTTTTYLQSFLLYTNNNIKLASTLIRADTNKTGRTSIETRLDCVDG
jgi:hypothetical protein